SDTRYGTLVAANLVAPNHDHFFNFRLDLDVDGKANSVVAARLQPEKPSTDRPQIWVVNQQAILSEKKARIRFDPGAPTRYLITNPGSKGTLGHVTSYVIRPQGYTSSLLNPDELAAKKNPYIQNHLWITPYNKAERYPGGDHVFLGKGGDTLVQWTQRDRPLANRDLVAWYTLGTHHVPRLEDWPVMPTHWTGFELVPFNFFAENPALAIEPTPAAQ
ncbi:MAG: tyramine oxidase, partial [Gammaproteobacteria bacterium]|nr:tyramine oxidase [Gammaproteobacteria bacterium]